ncbi:MAG: FUSC family protein, partial [Microvirga sp.]
MQHRQARAAAPIKALAASLVGTVAGVMLVVIADGQPVILVLGLALWIGLCTWSGNVLRGFVAYGTILAGYTAAMVALLDTAHPDHVLALGADRLLTVMTGVAEAIITQTLLSVACNAVHSVEARCCRWILSSRDRVGKDTIALTHEFLAEMLGVQRSTLSAVLRPL